MKGFKAEISGDLNKGCEFEYFSNLSFALKWVKSNAKLHLREDNEQVEVRIIKMNIKKCVMEDCTSLIEETEQICLKCEKIRDDALAEAEDMKEYTQKDADREFGLGE